VRLFERKWSVIAGGLDVSNLDLSFDVTKSTKREPNKATIRVLNLAPESRSKVSDSETISLRAGYKADGEIPPLLFLGDVRKVTHAYDAGTYTTTIEARDGGRAYSGARVSRSYNPGAPIATVLGDLANALGIGAGNLRDFAASARLSGTDTFPEGFVSSGQASTVLTGILRGAGLRWSVQNSALQIQRLREPLRVLAERLAPETGLIGSPAVGEKGSVSVRALLRPGLEPGRPVRVEAAHVVGDFEIRSVKFEGSTFGPEWYAALDLRRIDT